MPSLCDPKDRPTPWASSEVEPIEIGPHRIMVGDVTRFDVPRLMSGDLADVVYSDPPWGAGNLKYWRTHNKTPQAVDWQAFLTAFCQQVSVHMTPTAHVFVEMGRQWVDDLAREMAHVGIRETARWTVLYGKPARPNVLWYSGRPLVGTPEGLHGEPVTEWALSQVVGEGTLVLDPCCGKGMTSRYTHRLGGVFRGLELNPHRLGYTEQWLRKHSTP